MGIRANSDEKRAVTEGPPRGIPSWTSLTAGQEEWSKLPLSIVIPVLNEGMQIHEAVSKLTWADEVVVIDGGSTDRTRELAQAAGARVLRLAGQTIGSQRNAGIAIARNDWILALDADERVPESLQRELAFVLRNPQHLAYEIRFRNFYLGGELRHGGWGRDWHTRLFRRELRFSERHVHERLVHGVDAGFLSNAVEHTPYRDLTHHLEKMVRYARWGAEDLRAQGRGASVSDITFVPAWRFFREYVIFGGWRDGKRGLLAAIMGGCSAFLKYAYLLAANWQKPQSEPSASASAARAK